MSPQKANLVASVVRDMPIQQAAVCLSFSKNKGARVIKKLLDSALANDENNHNADIDKLRIKSLIVNQGMRLKRIKPRARGRADRITKPTCHIEIILTDEAI